MSRSSTETTYVPPEASRASLVYLFATLFVLWLAWSGHYTLDLTALFAAPHGVEEEAHGAEEEAHDAEEEAHGVVNPALLVYGLLTCAGVALLCRRMGIVDDETIPVHLAGRAVRYLPWLAWQVVLANLEVIRRILRPRPTDAPETVVVTGGQRSDVGLATYANSITLTPGTITVDLTDNTFTVHALTPATADGLLSGEMDREVTRYEGLA